MLSEHYYFFLSGGINKHIIDYELGLKQTFMLEERKRFWKDRSGYLPSGIVIFEKPVLDLFYFSL